MRRGQGGWPLATSPYLRLAQIEHGISESCEIISRWSLNSPCSSCCLEWWLPTITHGMSMMTIMTPWRKMLAPMEIGTTQTATSFLIQSTILWRREVLGKTYCFEAIIHNHLSIFLHIFDFPSPRPFFSLSVFRAGDNDTDPATTYFFGLAVMAAFALGSLLLITWIMDSTNVLSGLQERTSRELLHTMASISPQEVPAPLCPLYSSRRWWREPWRCTRPWRASKIGTTPTCQDLSSFSFSICFLHIN